MTIKLLSCAVLGLQTQSIEIEVDVSRGHPSFNIVGLPDTAIREAAERIRSAIRNSNITFPYEKRVIINLAPAHIRKIGPAYDVPMAVGILAHVLKITYDFNSVMFIGELSLGGKVRSVNGVLPRILHAREMGISKVFVPEANAAEAALVEGLEIIPIQTIGHIIDLLQNSSLEKPYISQQSISTECSINYDFADIKGQYLAKRALEIAAAGGHNVLMSGPPGSGKTLLAQSFPSILPEMTKDEVLEVTKIYSVAGLLHNCSMVKQRPFRRPHHTATLSSLIGGGSIPKPGEISLAHRGVLFCDEFLEFPRQSLEALRQPLEDGEVVISRSHGSFVFPASFILLAACNPCPCGFATDDQKECQCTYQQIFKYRRKISGPLNDRMDIYVNVPRLTIEELHENEGDQDSSHEIRMRVEQARKVQYIRYKSENIHINAELTHKMLRKYCCLDKESTQLLDEAVEQLYLTGRSYSRIIKLARTIADLEKNDTIKSRHLAEALQFRMREIVIN